MTLVELSGVIFWEILGEEWKRYFFLTLVVEYMIDEFQCIVVTTYVGWGWFSSKGGIISIVWWTWRCLDNGTEICFDDIKATDSYLEKEEDVLWFWVMHVFETCDWMLVESWYTGWKTLLKLMCPIEGPEGIVLGGSCRVVGNNWKPTVVGIPMKSLGALELGVLRTGVVIELETVHIFELICLLVLSLLLRL